jgi:hypothetical protein
MDPPMVIKGDVSVLSAPSACVNVSSTVFTAPGTVTGAKYWTLYYLNNKQSYFFTLKAVGQSRCILPLMLVYCCVYSPLEKLLLSLWPKCIWWINRRRKEQNLSFTSTQFAYFIFLNYHWVSTCCTLGLPWIYDIGQITNLRYWFLIYKISIVIFLI